MRYPVQNASSIPNSGNALYFYLLENISIPARMSHELWYTGCEVLKNDPTNPFQGFFPVGETLEISYGGSDMMEYTFTGEEQNPVFVKDLSAESKMKLGISATAKESVKVFNPYFVSYDDLSDRIKKDNELPALSLAKSIASFLSRCDIMFTEKDVIEMLIIAMEDANSPHMRHILHGNHMAWCASRFLLTGVMESDLKKNFYGQNDIDFYVKDIGTIMPSILYTFAVLGVNPMDMIKKLDYDLWGIKEVAEGMQKFMLINTEVKKTA
jgi:hypothetical protein